MADIAAEIEEGGFARTLKDLFAGAAGGIAQVLLGELCSHVFVWSMGYAAISGFCLKDLLCCD